MTVQLGTPLNLWCDITVMFGRMCEQSGFEYQRHPFSNIYFFTFVMQNMDIYRYSYKNSSSKISNHCVIISLCAHISKLFYNKEIQTWFILVVILKYTN